MPEPSLLVVPQVNINDDTVLLVSWSVPAESPVVIGDVVCVVETTKAAAEVVATARGILVPAVAAGTRVGVGEPLGVIGATAAEAKAFMAARRTPAAIAFGDSAATPKARALAARHQVSLEAVREAGVQGTIKETDVQRFMSRVSPALPGGLARYASREGELPKFDAAVAANLRRSTDHLILTTLDMTCRMGAVHAAVAAELAAGRMVSDLHFMVGAVARTLKKFPRLASFAYEGSLYQYRAMDVAVVVRAADGRLYTPVIRGADRLTPTAIARAAQAVTMRVLRATAGVEELEGAAFTISQVTVPGTTRVAALPSFGQSAILGVSAEWPRLDLIDGTLSSQPAVTLTLAYDHTLCDGVYAAEFLASVVNDLERPIDN